MLKKTDPEHLCSNCAHSEPVTDRWLARGGKPTLAHCAFRRYLVLYNGKCEERDHITGRDKFKPAKP